MMIDYFSDILRKVFIPEEGRFITWLRRHKLVAWLAAAVMIGVNVYILYGDKLRAPARRLLTNYTDWLLWVQFVWLALLTAYLVRKENVWNENQFTDDFRHGLVNWEFYGTWKTEREEHSRILIVTDSDPGGYVKKCRLWNDYCFEFETKIIQKNTSWIIRATDILNYLMLQCSPKSITPYLKINGQWVKLNAHQLPVAIPLKEWFRVAIKVTGTRVVIKATVKGDEYTFLDANILEPQLITAKLNRNGSDQETHILSSLPLGSIGFRAAGSECAHFRNIRVNKISVF